MKWVRLNTASERRSRLGHLQRRVKWIAALTEGRPPSNAAAPVSTDETERATWPEQCRG